MDWLVLAPGQRGIMDTTGLNLYGTSPAGGPVATAIGGTFSYSFDWAGTFPYDDPFHTAARGRVSVPIVVTHAVGAVETAAVTWASADPPAACARSRPRTIPSLADKLCSNKAIRLLINNTHINLYPNWLPPARSVAQLPGSIYPTLTR